MADISTWIDRHAAFTPNKTAIRFGGRDITYADLAARIAALSAVLQHKHTVKHGDRVAFLGHNNPDMLALLFACARLGAILMPLNWRLEAPEQCEILQDCTPVILVVETNFATKGLEICRESAAITVSLDDLVDDGPLAATNRTAGIHDPVLICYTSGATGKPKGVVLDQNALFHNAINSAHMHDMTSDDVVLNTLPLFHVGGINIQSLPVLHAGGTLVLHPVFDVAATFDALERDGITLTVLVPTQITAMMADQRWKSADFSTLRMIATGSTMVSRRLIDDVHKRGIPLIQVYGSTETAPLATYLRAADAVENAGSGGKTALHCEMRLVNNAGEDVAQGETGEILIKGPNVMQRYWNAPQRTAAVLRDGWFHTGDVGHLDHDGFLYVSDRKKDMIISGGENVYSAELENVLAECPEIAEAAIVGVPDDIWGEIVVAIIVAKKECKLDESHVAALFEGKIARYKHPRQVVFMNALPRNAMGKVIKDQLRREMVHVLKVENPEKRQSR